MKPSFALTLSHDSIGLLHRTAQGWVPVGTVALDDPDLDGALEYLRRTALGLEPQGFATKVVIPNSEILYDSVFAPGPKAAIRRAQIAAALEGRTPYAVDDLVFDWSGTGDMVQVAVVARETLAEAEGFARQHGFNPVSLVALPEPGGFGAEPWFGTTACAPEILAPGEKVVRDQDPIRIITRPGSRTKTPAAVPEPETEPAVEAEPAAEVAGTASPEAVPQQPEPEPPAAGAETPLAAEPEPFAEPEPAPAPVAASIEPEPPAPEPPAAETPNAPAGPVAAMAEVAVETAAAQDPPSDAAPPETVAPEPEAPVAAPPRDLPPLAEIGPDQTLSWPGDDSDGSLDRAQAALAASLAPPPGPAEAALVAGLRREDDLADIPPPVSAPVQRALAAARATRDAGSATRETARAEPPAPGLSEKMQKIIAKTAKPSKAKVKEKAPGRNGAAPVGPPPLPASASQPQVPPARTEAEKMTVFGQRRAPVGGKPRFLGLALIGGLLLVLLLIAVWAATVLEPPRQGGAVPQAAPTETAGSAPVDPAPEAAQDGVQDTALPTPETAPTAEPTETATTEPPPPEETVAALPEAPPQGVAADQAAATGPAGPASDAGAEVQLPRADEALSGAAVPSLAALPGADPAPGAAPVLPEFGALYQFGADGQILPTPDGVITPDGVRLVAGRPERLPPPRPEGLAPGVAAGPPAAESPPPAETVAEPTPAPAAPAPGGIAILPASPAPPEPAETATFQPDSTLPQRRPPQRPAGLEVPAAPAAAAAEEDQGALPAADLAAYAARRPAKRPEAIAAAAAAATEAERAREVAAAAAAAAAAASTAAAQPETVTGLAPTRRPPARPADFSRAVAAAVAAAVAPPAPTTRTAPAARQPEPEPQRAASRSAAPDHTRGARGEEVLEDNEPEVSGRAPSVPTRASVARQATVTGALNLGRTNLIGVFGTQNARYALVRESGGRLVRVKVGDRIDGGRVTAIGQTDLSYQRGGQTVQLRMPRG